MKKVLLMMLAAGFLLAGLCQADGYEAELSAGNTSIQGGFHFKNNLANGFWKAGGSALYTDDDETEYKWVEVDFMMGNETWQPGLTCEVGVKGIVGEAEDYIYSGDVGALAFNGQVEYVFPRQTMPIPLELFAGIAYAPDMLSFEDTENYLAIHMGMGLRIIENASIILKFTSYDVDMESGPRAWNLDDDVIRLGLVMRF